ncbi:LpqB family beta-propeller domain-containing protein [Microbacterium karelineae]|uniref:LpqB family beta-propeller domain-containing protein n=1 Tax=Microbacterium karelineae TaxID=2654283 RepID=UPI0012E9A26A|nr:LpqB family beta-propeller domain-containing protein [Microbacterium karelineae]
MRARRGAIAAVFAGILVLGGCAGLPIDGTFQPGDEVGADAPELRWQFTPDGPAEGASPADIVYGFLDAGESPADDWGIAREFLTDEAAAGWDPNARITIDDINERNVGEFAAAEGAANRGEADVRVTPTATVDENGRYDLSDGGVRPLEFELALVDGEWRISSAPDGVVVQSGTFASIFTSTSLVFSAPGDRLVPDVRWFPDTAELLDRIVAALVDDGPSPWLEGAVRSAFDGVDLRGVELDDDLVATVALSSEAADVGLAQRARMQTQLEQTLTPIGVQAVRMTSVGDRLAAVGDEVVSTEPDSRAIVLTDDAFGYLTAGDITPIPGLSEPIAEQFAPEGDGDDPATSIAVAPDLSHAILQTESGTLVRVHADDATWEVLSFESDWVEPSLDAFGYAWSARPDEPGQLRAWADGEPDPATVPGLGELTEISGLEVSRDGARIAITGRQENQPALVVAGIRRDDDGAPIALTAVQDVVELLDDAEDVAWVSDTIVAVTAAGEGRTIIREQQVGGTSERITAALVATEITYGNPRSRERLLGDDGFIYVRNTTQWQQAGGGAVVLATQMGAPPPAE